MTKQGAFKGLSLALLIALMCIFGWWQGIIATIGCVLIFLWVSFFIKKGRASGTATASKFGWVKWVLLVVLGIAWIVQVGHKSDEIEKLEGELVEKKARPPKEWIAYWQCGPGEMFEGMTKSDEQVAEVTLETPTEQWFDVYYLEYGRPETAKLRLYKQDGDIWEGHWSQVNPPRNGRLVLFRQVNPDYWTGVMAGQNGQNFLYTIRVKSKP